MISHINVAVSLFNRRGQQYFVEKSERMLKGTNLAGGVMKDCGNYVL